jgi:hypothetical protein
MFDQRAGSMGHRPARPCPFDSDLSLPLASHWLPTGPGGPGVSKRAFLFRRLGCFGSSRPSPREVPAGPILDHARAFLPHSYEHAEDETPRLVRGGAGVRGLAKPNPLGTLVWLPLGDNTIPEELASRSWTG